jgi:hypothetical protein
MELTPKDPAYWKERAKQGKEYFTNPVGRPKSLESPAELWELACQYFERVTGEPWFKKDWKGKDAFEVEAPTAAPFLWSGFEDFLFEKKGITTLKDYRTASRNEDYRDGTYREFAEVVRAIDNIMTTQKVSGALVGAYNSNLVARLEGLVDKSEETVIVKETKVGFN